MPASRGSSQPQGLNLRLLHVPALIGRFFTTAATWEAWLRVDILLDTLLLS